MSVLSMVTVTTLVSSSCVTGCAVNYRDIRLGNRTWVTHPCGTFIIARIRPFLQIQSQITCHSACACLAKDLNPVAKHYILILYIKVAKESFC